MIGQVFGALLAGLARALDGKDVVTRGVAVAMTAIPSAYYMTPYWFEYDWYWFILAYGLAWYSFFWGEFSPVLDFGQGKPLTQTERYKFVSWVWGLFGKRDIVWVSARLALGSALVLLASHPYGIALSPLCGYLCAIMYPFCFKRLNFTTGWLGKHASWNRIAEFGNWTLIFFMALLAHGLGN